MKELQDSKYFSVKEMLHSDTADRLKIDNTPISDEIVDNIQYLMSRLDEIRGGYGKPIYINSGYRCAELNKLVGGKPNSQHLKGEAADLRFDIDLLNFIIQFCHFDQLIIEKSKTSKWIHISFKIDKDKERNQVLNITV